MTVSDEIISFIKNTQNIDNALDVLETYDKDLKIEYQILKTFENSIKNLTSKEFSKIRNDNYLTYFYQSENK